MTGFRQGGRAGIVSETFQKRVAELSVRFSQGLPDRFAAIERLAAHLRAGGAAEGAPLPGDLEPPLRELRRRLHEIAGVAATLGFPGLGATARQLEQPLAEVIGQRGRLDDVPVGAALADPRRALEDALVADRAAAGL